MIHKFHVTRCPFMSVLLEEENQMQNGEERGIACRWSSEIYLKNNRKSAEKQTENLRGNNSGT